VKGLNILVFNGPFDWWQTEFLLQILYVEVRDIMNVYLEYRIYLLSVKRKC